MLAKEMQNPQGIDGKYHPHHPHSTFKCLQVNIQIQNNKSGLFDNIK